MAWTEIKQAYSTLASAVSGNGKLEDAWDAFVTVVTDHADSPPYHLVNILDALDTIRDRGNAPRDSIAILDQGCGGGLTLLYLAASGYVNIRGVDVNDSNCERWNTLTKDLLGLPAERFKVYDGKTLPIDSNSIDLLISQEVLEHVTDDVVDAYYCEGARVLKSGGIALHSVPHRLVPYDSHSQTWLLHVFLPRKVWLRALRMIGKSNETVERALFLRWPWTHTKYLKKHFGAYRNTTSDRLIKIQSFDYYDGNIGLRRLIARGVRLPIVGALLAYFLSTIMMMDTKASTVD